MADAIMRHQWESFLNIGTASAPDYRRMGTGFEDLSDSRNPDVSEKTYISDAAATKRIRGYSPEWSFNGDALRDEDVIVYLRDIGITLATGEAAETTYIEFDVEDVETDLSVVAYRYDVTIQMDSVMGGAGGEEGTFSGTLHGNGDPVKGTFDTSTNTFSPDVS